MYRSRISTLCVGAERGIQAALLAKIATERGGDTVAHGCTAAGNDQVRFEVALRTRARADLFIPDGHCNDAGYTLMGATAAETLTELMRR